MSGSFDYIYFVEGVNALLIAVSCVRMTGRGRQDGLPWLSLMVFGVCGGFMMWTEMISMSLPESVVLSLARSVLLAGALLGLFEFGRRGLRAQGVRVPGFWCGCVLLAVAGTGGWFGHEALQAALRGILGFPGAVLSGWVLWRAGAPGRERSALRVAGAGIVLFALATALLVATAHYKLSRWDGALPLGHGLRAATSGLCASGLWLYWRFRRGAASLDNLFQDWVLPVALVLLLGMGWLGARWYGKEEDGRLREGIRRQAASIAQTINPALVRALAFDDSDKERAEFQRLSRLMADYARFSGLRSVYTMRSRDGKIVFGPESIPAGGPLSSPPGTVYKKPSAGVKAFFSQPKVLVFGPYKNEYGTFVTGLAPVSDWSSKEFLLAVGVDCLASNWNVEIARARLSVILPTLFLLLVVMGGMEILRWRSEGGRGNWCTRHIEVLVTVVFGGSMSLFMALGVRQVERAGNLAELHRYIDVHAAAVANGLIDKRDGLGALARFCRGQERLTRGDFESFATPLSRYTTVKALEWVQAVPAGEREAFEESMGAQGLAGFSIHERDTDGAKVRASGRELFFPVSFVVPFAENEQALGFDLGSETQRREILMGAQKTNLAMCSAPINLVQGGQTAKGVLYLHQVLYPQGGRLRGFAVSVLQPQRELEAGLDAEQSRSAGIVMSIWDLSGEQAPQRLAQVPLNNRSAVAERDALRKRPPFSELVPFFMGGRAWGILVETTGIFWASRFSWAGLAIGVLGSLLTCVLSGLVSFQIRYRERLEKQVRERTLELRTSTAELTARTGELQQSEARHRLAMGLARIAHWEFDVATGLFTFNEQFYALYGTTIEREGGRQMSAEKYAQRFLFPEEASLVAVELGKALATTDPKYEHQLTHRIRKPDGEEGVVTVRFSIVKDEQGRTIKLYGANQEVTAQKKAEEALRTERDLFASGPVIVISWVPSGAWPVNYISANVESILGYTPEEMAAAGFMFTSLIHPEDRERVAREVADHLATGLDMFEQSYRLRTKAGGYRWFYDVNRFIRNQQREVISIRGYMIDQTNLKQVELALSDERRRLGQILDGTRSGTWEWEVPSGKVIFNERWAEIVGYSLAELQPTTIETWSKLCHPDDLEASRQELEKHFAGDLPHYECECRMKHKDGHWIWVHDRGSVVSRDAAGKPLLVFGTHVDVSSRKQAELKLRETNQRLMEAMSQAKEMALQARRADQAKSAFLANMSHEIRTPMNAVIGMMQLLLDTPLSTKQEHYARVVRSNAESLLHLLSDILDFSKIEAGHMELENVEFDFVQMLEEFSVAPALQSEKKGLRFSCRIEPEVPVYLRGDPSRLRQVLVNLTSNAIKFTERGEVAVRVSVADERAGFVVLRFSVRDTGIGIPVEKQALLFKSFSQVDTSTTREYGGTGLGLAISKQLTELMGGEIGVQSSAGQGSEFWFTVSMQRLPKLSRPSPTRTGSRSVFKTSNNRQARILLAEDLRTNQEVAIGMLKALGCTQVEVAVNGQEALAALEGKAFDLVFMDVQMPVMDGLEATRQIRARASGLHQRQAPIIAMTAHAMQGDREKCLAAGMDDYLVKPLMPDALRRVLEKWLPDSLSVAAPSLAPVTVAVEQEPLVFNRKVFFERMFENKELACVVVGGFLNETAAYLLELERHVHDGAFDQVKSVAHALAGSAANINGEAFSRTAREIEQAALKADHAGMANQLLGLRKEYERLQDVLQRELFDDSSGSS